MRLFLLINVLLLGSLLVACASKEDNTLKVGVIAGPEMTLMEVAKQQAAERFNLNIKIVSFSDYMTPNVALAEGVIDANMMQHLPFLQAVNQARHLQLKAIGKTFIYPMGVYSQKLKSLAHLPQRAKVALPNDPSNQARALELLAKAQLITIKKNPMVNLHDILTNTHQLQFIELDAAQLVRALEDVDLAVINTNYAMINHLYPSKDALYREDDISRYMNIVAVRENDNREALTQLMAALQSDAVKQKAWQLFHGEAIAGF